MKTFWWSSKYDNTPQVSIWPLESPWIQSSNLRPQCGPWTVTVQHRVMIVQSPPIAEQLLLLHGNRSAKCLWYWMFQINIHSYKAVFHVTPDKRIRWKIPLIRWGLWKRGRVWREVSERSTYSMLGILVAEKWYCSSWSTQQLQLAPLSPSPYFNSGLLPKHEDVSGLAASLALGEWGGVGWGGGRRGGLGGGCASIGAALGVGVLPGTLHGRDVATVPHPWTAQLTQVMEAARDSG